MYKIPHQQTLTLIYTNIHTYNKNIKYQLPQPFSIFNLLVTTKIFIRGTS